MADDRVRILSEPDGLEARWMKFSARNDHSHRLWTDDYLAAFAETAGATFVTLDAAIEARYPSVTSSAFAESFILSGDVDDDSRFR